MRAGCASRQVPQCAPWLNCTALVQQQIQICLLLYFEILLEHNLTASFEGAHNKMVSFERGNKQ